MVIRIRCDQQIVDLLQLKAGQAEIELHRVEFLQLEGEQFLVPVGPRGGAIDHQAESLHLSRRPLVTQDDRDIGHAQLARGLEAQVSVNHFAVASDQTWNLEAELTNAAAHAIYRRIVPTRVARVMDQLVDWPELNLHKYFLHTVFYLPGYARQPQCTLC